MVDVLNTEIFKNHNETKIFTLWEDEDNNCLMMSWIYRGTVNTEITSVGVKPVSLEDLKHLLGLCRDERPCYSLGVVDETEFYIEINSPGEKRYIVFNEYGNRDITVKFLTRGMYMDKSDPNNWKEREYVMEVGSEHKLTCRDLYRIRKMCNISD